MRQITKADLKEVHRIMEWGITYQDIVDIYNVRPQDFRGAFLSNKPDQIVGKFSKVSKKLNRWMLVRKSTNLRLHNMISRFDRVTYVC